jgi:hypothetical protein
MIAKIRLSRDELHCGGFEMEPYLFSFPEFKTVERLIGDQRMKPDPYIRDDICSPYTGNDFRDGSFKIIGCT